MSDTDKDTGFDFSKAYRADNWGAGIAWRATGYVTEQQIVYEDCEFPFSVEYEEVENCERVVAHMIGDDRNFEFDVTDLTPLDDDAYCRSCGQVGCTHNAYE